MKAIGKFTMTFTGERAEFLRKVRRRTLCDLEQYIIDGLWEDFRKDAYCLLDEDYRTQEYCAHCCYAEYCLDEITVGVSKP